MDPWSSGGVLEAINDKIDIIKIEGEAHHLDLRSSNVEDPESVINARIKEILIITKWLKDFNLNSLANKSTPQVTLQIFFSAAIAFIFTAY